VISVSSVQHYMNLTNLTNLTNLGLTAFIDHRHPKGILVLPPNLWAGLNWHSQPYHTRSGDHKNAGV